MEAHEVDYKVGGDDLQYVEVELDPDETVIAEAGAMLYKDDAIHFEAKMGDGSEPAQGFFDSVLSAGKRMLTGESLFVTHFTNEGTGKNHVAFAAPYPGKVVPVDMSEMADQKLVCQKDAFLAAALGTKMEVELNKNIGAGFFGGEGFILQRLEGDGMAFMHAGGTIIERKLEGEKLQVDSGCLVGFEVGIDYSIEKAGGLKTMLTGGEGLFLARLQGTGRVWLQSLPLSKLADRIIASAPSQGGEDTGEGGAAGEIAGSFFGD